VADGAPIDVVGLQTHLIFDEPDWELFRRTMKALGDLGVRVWVTELDAPVATDLPDRLAVQADRKERAVQTAARSVSITVLVARAAAASSRATRRRRRARAARRRTER